MAAMVFVENPGGWPFPRPGSHAAWHQPITPTDWIFPVFIFIMGVCIPLALTKRKESGASLGKIYLKIFRRTVLLFALGYFLLLMYDLPDMKLNNIFAILRGVNLPGVLQTIAIVYMFSSLIFLKTSWKTQVWIVVGFLIAYSLALNYLPFPGGEPGVFTEGRRRAYTLRDWVDMTVLRMDRGHAAGILVTLSAVTTGLIGALTGQWLMKENEPTVRTVWLFVAGSLLMIIGGVWAWWFPIIKDLWTSTYVLYTAGLGIIGVALCYWVVDVLEYKRWTPPFVAYGINCISVYFASHAVATIIGYYIKWETPDGEISLKGWIIKNIFARGLEHRDPALLYRHALYSLAIVLFWLIPLYIMYRKKWIIKV